MKFLVVIFVILINSNQSFCQLDSMKFTPTKDNSLFSEGNNLSDGAGLFIYVGRTNNSSEVQVRRGLMRFDVSIIPINAHIQSVKLTLITLKSVGNSTVPHNFTLHKLVSNWGEGTSNGNGAGSPASINDATRQNTFYPSSNWNTNGGDFINAASATAISVINKFTEWSSPEMVNDVNAWVTNPISNFGWLIKGQEDF